MNTYEELERLTDDGVEKAQETARDIQLNLLQGIEERDERIELVESERDAALEELEELKGRVAEFEERSNGRVRI